jgi:hypothetical protein
VCLYFFCPVSILQGIHSVMILNVCRGNCSNHDGLRITTQTIFKYSCQFAARTCTLATISGTNSGYNKYHHTCSEKKKKEKERVPSDTYCGKEHKQDPSFAVSPMHLCSLLKQEVTGWYSLHLLAFGPHYLFQKLVHCRQDLPVQVFLAGLDFDTYFSVFFSQ